VESEVVNRAVRVGDCRPHPKNYNQHAPEQIANLRVSLRRFGQVRSIVVQETETGYLLVAGHGIHRAAWLEGLDTLRADVIPAGWDEPRVLAYLAADNELARLGKPDEAQLAALVAEVKAKADAELATLAAGTEARLQKLLAQVADEPGDWVPVEQPEMYLIIIECETESRQVELLERFMREGLSCRALVS